MSTRTKFLVSAWQIFWLIAGIVVGVAVLVGAQTIPVVLPHEHDSDLFFQECAKANRLLRERKHQEAAITMDVLCQNLTDSPWLEIGLLKYAEMNETRNVGQAKEAYARLRKRIDEAPYYRGATDREQLFRVRLEAAMERGVNRVRLHRIREALGQYFGRHARYPESLASLAILGFIDQADIVDAKGQPIRYIPTGVILRVRPTFQRYEMDHLPPEPFMVKSPRIDGTSRVSDNPIKYAALIRPPGMGDARRVVDFQILEGFFIAAIADKGAIVCSPDRVLVLPVAK